MSKCCNYGILHLDAREWACVQWMNMLWKILPHKDYVKHINEQCINAEPVPHTFKVQWKEKVLSFDPSGDSLTTALDTLNHIQSFTTNWTEKCIGLYCYLDWTVYRTLLLSGLNSVAAFTAFWTKQCIGFYCLLDQTVYRPLLLSGLNSVSAFTAIWNEQCIGLYHYPFCTLY